MKNYNSLAFAFALSTSIIYSVFSLLCLFAHKHVLRFIASAHHIKTLDPLQPELSVNNYIIGLIFNFVLVFVVVWLAGFIYVNVFDNRNR